MQFHHIGNEAVPASSGRTLPVIDPSDGQPFDEIQRGTAPKTDNSGGWTDLTPRQRQALAPLAAVWPNISPSQRSKWLVLSRNFQQLPPAEQAKMHSRMADWVAMTPQQRSQARLNFAETTRIPATDKKAMWEAYQALPTEEKRKLAARGTAAKPPAPVTAAAIRPVPAQKLAKMPKPDLGDARAPRIEAAAALAATPATPAEPAHDDSAHH